VAIQSLDQYIAAAKQRITYTKLASRTSVAAMPFSIFDIAGNPGAGTLGGSDVNAGVVPDDSIAGYPNIAPFNTGATGYISKIEFMSPVAGWLNLYDRLWLAGPYNFNAASSLAAQPSLASRLPDGSYNGLELWVETVTPFTGNLTISVNYTKEDGTTGRTTGAFATGLAPTLGRCIQLPLAAGDRGIQKVESLSASVATVGTFNLMILRPVWSGRVQVANAGDVHDLLRTGMPKILTNSALYCLVTADSTATSTPSMIIEIANG